MALGMSVTRPSAARGRGSVWVGAACIGLCVGLLVGCVPIEPLVLVPPDAGPIGCATADDCPLPGAQAACIAGACVVASCEPGRVDEDGDPGNGCERCDVRPGSDGCDGIDSDCDGQIDEDGDGTVSACGACDAACSGVEAEHACVENRCVIEACSAGRYALGGDGEGCACSVDALRPRAIETQPPIMPRGPRLAFPGDGRPGVAVWTRVDDGEHRLWRWGLTVDGRTIERPEAIGALPGPSEIYDVWFGASDEPVVVVSEPVDGGRERLTVWSGDSSRVMADDCSSDDCRVVRLPGRGAGIVRREVDGDVRVLDPDGEPIETWRRPMDGPVPDVELVGAACLDTDRCVAVVRHDGLRLIGLIDLPLDDVDEVDLVAGGGRLWLAGRIDDRVLVLATDGQRVSGPVELEPRGWRAPRVLPEPDGGAWVVATADERPVGLELDDGLRPLGDGAVIAAGFSPAGLAGPGLFFDHRPQVGSVQRRLWTDFPDGTPMGDAPVRALGGRLVYRTDTGVFAMPTGDEAAQPTLLLRRLAGPPRPVAAALVEGRPWIVDVVPEGLVALDIDNGERRSIDLRLDGESVAPGSTTAVDLAPDGRLAVVGQVGAGPPLFGLGHLDDAAVMLMPTGLAPEMAVRLIGGPGSETFVVSRLDPGVGHETLIRRLDESGQSQTLRLARRLHPEAVAAANADGALVAWLDRQTDRCGDGPDTVRVAYLLEGRSAAPDTRALPVVACPRALAVSAFAGGFRAVLASDEGATLVPLGPTGQMNAPAVSVALDVLETVSLAPDTPTAIWASDGRLHSLPFDCRDAESLP